MAEVPIGPSKPSGKALTWGPDEQGRYMAGKTCTSCGAQVLGPYVKRNPCEHVPSPGPAEHRAAAILTVDHMMAEHHVCGQPMAPCTPSGAVSP